MKPKALLAELLKQMNELHDSDDVESAHASADRILCDLLIQLGFKDLIDSYEKVHKWYS